MGWKGWDGDGEGGKGGLDSTTAKILGRRSAYSREGSAEGLFGYERARR